MNLGEVLDVVGHLEYQVGLRNLLIELIQNMKEKFSKNKIIIISGISADGKLNTNAGLSSKSFDINLPEEIFDPLRTKRKSFDAVVVGINTALIDNPHLLSEYNSNLRQIVVDSKCRIDLDSELVNDKRCNLILVTTNKADKSKIDQLKAKNIDVLICGKSRVDLHKMVEELSKININNLMIEGGGKIIHSFLKEKLVDEIHLVIFPFLVGNNSAIPLINGRGFNFNLNLKLIKSKILSKNFILNIYKVIYE